MWPNQHLAAKLGTIVAIMGGVLVLVLAIAIIAIQQVIDAADQRAQAQEHAQIAYQLRGDIQGLMVAVVDMAWMRTDRSGDIALQKQRFAHDLVAARQDQDVADSAILADLEAQYADLAGVADQMVAASHAGDDTSAAALWISGKEMAERSYDIADRYYRLQAQRADAARGLVQQRQWFALILLAASGLVALALGSGAATLISRSIVRTLQALTEAAQQLLSGRMATVAVASRDEIGTLATAFNTMAQEVQAQRAAQERWNAQLVDRVNERTQALQEAVTHQEQLLQVIREMSTPVIPLARGTLVMPLVGLLDADRMVRVQESMTSSVTAHSARRLIIDITGVPIVDTKVARSLLDGMHMVRLLGAACIIVGVRPEVAQSLVSLNIDMGSFQTASDLQSAMVTAHNGLLPAAQPSHALV